MLKFTETCDLAVTDSCPICANGEVPDQTRRHGACVLHEAFGPLAADLTPRFSGMGIELLISKLSAQELLDGEIPKGTRDKVIAVMRCFQTGDADTLVALAPEIAASMLAVGHIVTEEVDGAPQDP